MRRTRKRRHLTSQRDGIRVIGWYCVGLAPLVLAASKVNLEAGRDALVRLCESGLGWACPPPNLDNPASWRWALILLGFGILLLAIRPPVRVEERIECPFCAEPIRVEAVVCPHCRTEFARSNGGRTAT
jgi:hypothetical protein